MLSLLLEYWPIRALIVHNKFRIKIALEMDYTALIFLLLPSLRTWRESQEKITSKNHLDRDAFMKLSQKIRLTTRISPFGLTMPLDLLTSAATAINSREIVQIEYWTLWKSIRLMCKNATPNSLTIEAESQWLNSSKKIDNGQRHSELLFILQSLSIT